MAFTDEEIAAEFGEVTGESYDVADAIVQGLKIGDAQSVSLDHVTLVNLTPLRRWLDDKRLGREIAAIVVEKATEVGQEMIKWIQANVPREDWRAARTLVADTDVSSDDTKIVMDVMSNAVDELSGKDYGYYALEHGRPGGRRPPFNAMERWIDERSIGQYEQEQRVKTPPRGVRLRRNGEVVKLRDMSSSVLTSYMGKSGKAADWAKLWQVRGLMNYIAAHGVTAPRLISRCFEQFKPRIVQMQEDIIREITEYIKGQTKGRSR